MDLGKPLAMITLNRFGADGWEMVGIQGYRDGEGGEGSSHWDASRHIITQSS